MRLPKEDYKNAVGILKRYNYNCVNILRIRMDIMGVSVPEMNGMPKAVYNISDEVFNKYIKLQEDKSLQKSLKEYNIVKLALQLLTKEHEKFFNLFYVEQKTKWEIMDELALSERTFGRRKNELISAVDKELKKVGINLAKNH